MNIIHLIKTNYFKSHINFELVKTYLYYIIYLKKHF